MGLLDTILSALGLRKQVSDTLDSPPAARAFEEAAAAAADSDDDDQDDHDDDDHDDDDDDGVTRDYDLEARDDQAGFDFDNAIERYFEAQFRIERHWENEAKRAELFSEYGVREGQHWYQVKATYERWSESPAVVAKYGSSGDLMQVQMGVVQRVAMQEMSIGNQHQALAEDLAPVEGVTLEQWAKAQAQIASGGDWQQAVAALNVDQPTWDRVSAEWNARMSRDTSFTITTEYSKHFQSAGVGQFSAAAAAAATGQVGPESSAPITLERYVEIEVAQSAGVGQGKDAAAILQSFGMSAMEWGQVGGWWSMYISQNAMKNDGELHKRYSRLQEEFTAKYKTASADDDIAF